MARGDNDSLGNMRQVGDAIGAALYKTAKADGSNIGYREHPGKGLTNLSFGMHRLRGRALQLGMSAEGIDVAERKAHEQFAKASQILESPIERSMVAALLTGWWTGFDTIPPLVHDSRKDTLEVLPPGDIVFVPQMAFLKFRLDLGIIAEKGGKRHVIAVECDGAAFHGDIRKEHIRDAYLASWDIPVLHFTGAELHDDAIASADSVISAICQWRAT